MWKLTTDELPPEDVRVLARYPYRDAGIDAFLDILIRDGSVWSDQEGWIVDAPTHWMPIPDPPAS